MKQDQDRVDVNVRSGGLEELLSIQEVAKYFSVSLRTLQNLRNESSFPRPVKLGKAKIAFRKNDIVNFVSKGGLV